MRPTGKTLPQDAQKGQPSHPPNPGAPTRRTVPRARPQRVTKDSSSKLARLLFYDGSVESPTVRVQRGSSETAGCASTGDSLGHHSPCWRTFSASCITVSTSNPDSPTPLLRFPAPSYFHLRATEAGGRWPAAPRAAQATRQHSAAPASLHP